MMSSSTIADAVRASGYAADTPLAVGVSTGGEEPLFFAQGDGLDGASFGLESVAYAASLAKQITGACVALLARRGALDPDAPIAAWMPELPWRERVRVRHLIHHTAGLPDVPSELQKRGKAGWTSPSMLAALADTPRLAADPGSAYAYSNAGYICLAAIVERISGSPFSDFARTQLFEPLEMKRTMFWTGPSAAPPTAAVVPEPPPPLSAGDGGLWTTVSDLLRWNAAILGDALGITSRMHTAGSLDNGTPLDYAWGVRVFRASGQTVHSHGGDWASATAMLVRLPDSRASFAVLAADRSVDRMVTLGDLLTSGLSASGSGASRARRRRQRS